MAEVSVGGVSFKGFGKISALFLLASTIISGGWFGFKLWDQWLDLNDTVSQIEKPDLSDFDKRIELIKQEVSMLKSEMAMILEEVNLVASTAKELKDDLKSDVRQLEKDSRHTESLVDSIKNDTREELRLFENQIKKLDEDLDLKINKALANPLAGVK